MNFHIASLKLTTKIMLRPKNYKLKDIIEFNVYVNKRIQIKKKKEKKKANSKDL